MSRNATSVERKYASIKQSVEAAGFFCPQIREEPDWDCIVCTSEYRDGYGYTGCIVNVTKAADGNWYLATPHPYHYRVCDPACVAEVVVTFLRRDDDTPGRLLQISDEEYEMGVRKG